MEYRLRVHALGAAGMIALGGVVSLVTSTVVAARAYRAHAAESARQNQAISVKGSTRQRIRSDRAVWRIHLEGRGKTLPDAYAALERTVARTREFLEGRGFAAEHVALDAIDTSERFVHDAKGNATDEISSYTLTRTVTVTTGEVDRVNRAAGEVTELIQEGLHVISAAPEYVFTQLAALRIDLMAAASADARARAEKISASTGCRLGELRSAHMGVVQITAPDSTEVSGYGMYDTQTIDKDVTAVVTATFGIAKL